MTVTITADTNRPTAVVVEMTRGDPFALVLKVDPSRNAAAAVLFDALADRTWLAQVRARPETAGSALVTLTKSEEVIDDADNPDDGKRVIVFACDDSSALAGGRTYYVDAQVLDGPMAGDTFLDGSTIVVNQDVSQ